MLRNLFVTVLASAVLGACNAQAPGEPLEGPDRGSADTTPDVAARDVGSSEGGLDPDVDGGDPADIRLPEDAGTNDVTDEDGTPDATVSDASSDAPIDTSSPPDVTVDADPTDALADVSPDAPVDGGTDLGRDARDDVAPDTAGCDEDGDGALAISCGGDDCDDTDGQRAPEREEVCDFVDNDCDSFINQGLDCRIYAHTSSRLYLVDPFLGTEDDVGPIPDLLDFDTSPGGALYGVTNARELLRYDVENDAWLTVGATGIEENANGFAIDSDERAFLTAGNTLYRVNLETAAATRVGSMGIAPSELRYNSSGDCVVDKEDALFMTSNHAEFDILIRIDAETGESVEVGDTGFDALWGLTSAFGYLFAFSAGGQVILLDGLTAEGTLLYEFTGRLWYGAASSPGR